MHFLIADFISVGADWLNVLNEVWIYKKGYPWASSNCLDFTNQVTYISFTFKPKEEVWKDVVWSFASGLYYFGFI